MGYALGGSDAVGLNQSGNCLIFVADNELQLQPLALLQHACGFSEQEFSAPKRRWVMFAEAAFGVL